jgi:hypothetical protein
MPDVGAPSRPVNDTNLTATSPHLGVSKTSQGYLRNGLAG